MMLNDKAKALLDKPKQFATISTIEPDGRPQSSVVWYVRDGDDVLVSTVADRRKHKNMVRDPRVTLLVYDAENPYEYVEIRGRVQMTTEGGRELIDDLARAYMGADRYTMDDGTDNVRVVCRIVAEKVVSR
ncbi:MAG: PPOX class F420-dependent oxidoreductase [Candidatus Nanopelagicales bacterium]